MAMRVLRAACLRLKGRDGQMTVELMAVLPVAIVIAVIAVNALAFFGDCASFDRLARNAIRVHATSPAYGMHAAQCRAGILGELQSQVEDEFRTVWVSYEGMGGGLARYTATLEYAPNLFGMGMRASVLGVQLPRLRHSTSLVVDPYKPGVFLE